MSGPFRSAPVCQFEWRRPVTVTNWSPTRVSVEPDGGRGGRLIAENHAGGRPGHRPMLHLEGDQLRLLDRQVELVDAGLDRVGDVLRAPEEAVPEPVLVLVTLQ